jgi:MFS family permease
MRLVTPLVAGSLLNPVNTTLIAVALIPIGRTFGAGPEKTAWLLTALYLATAIGQPVIGLFVDRFGPRRVLLAGALVVIMAGIAGTFAFSLGWLVGVRVVLGVGTCAGFPAAMAVLRRRADATGSGVPSRVLSILAMSGQTIMVIGPALGGALIGLAGWPAIFAVNIPLGLASLVLALLWIPADDRAGLKRERIDVAGIVLFSATLLAVLLFVMEPAVRDLWLLAVAAVLGAVFVRTETRSAKPFVDLRMLAGNGPLLRTYLRQALAFLIVYSIMFGYVQWLESARGLSESTAGAVLLPMSAVAVLASALSAKPTGIKTRLIANSLALVGGAALLLVVDIRSWLGALIGIAAVFGLGQGLTSVTNQTVLYGQAPAEQIGTASGLFRTAQYLGAIAASTLIALCFGTQVSSAGLHKLAWTLLGAGALLLVVTLADRTLGASGKTREQAR